MDEREPTLLSLELVWEILNLVKKNKNQDNFQIDLQESPWFVGFYIDEDVPYY